MRRTLPGKRVEPIRAWMMATTFKGVPRATNQLPCLGDACPMPGTAATTRLPHSIVRRRGNSVLQNRARDSTAAYEPECSERLRRFHALACERKLVHAVRRFSMTRCEPGRDGRPSMHL